MNLSSFALNNLTDDFIVFRNGKEISTIKGFFTSDEYPDSIQTCSEFKLKVNDILHHVITDEDYKVYNLKPLTYQGKLEGYIVQYKPKENINSNVNYNITSMSGNNIVGSNTSVNINGITFNELSNLIKDEIPDLQDQQDLIKALKEIDNSDTPIKKGALSRFSDLLKKHESLIIPIGNHLFDIFFSNNSI